MNDPIDITTPAAFEQACAEVDSQLGGMDDPVSFFLDDAEVEIIFFGLIDRGIDGKDVYLLLTRKDVDLTPEQAHNWLCTQIDWPTRGPGRMFLKTMTTVQTTDNTNQVICTVQERYDV